MKEKKILIFDIDGTLYDNIALGFQKFNRNLSGLGLKTLTPDWMRQHWGLKVDDLFSHIAQEVGATYEQELALRERDKALSMETDYKLDKHLLNAVLSLKDFGFLIGILTSRTDNSLEALAKKTGLPLSQFDYVQTITSYPYHKPDGRVFNPVIDWAHSLGYQISDIVYFGDTIKFDYEATLNSSPLLDFVGVVSGVNTKEEFLASGLEAANIISSFDCFPAFLHNLIKQKVEA